MDQEIRKEIKTFFLNADSSLTLDDTQLQSLFLAGFEVYPLRETRLIPLEDQVACLVDLFEELIVFFNVDTPLPSGDWPTLLRGLSDTHGERVRLGVLHHEFDPQRRADLERFYLLEARIQAGCIYLGQRRTPDLPKLRKILVANQANGRRKAIRMACTGRMNFSLKGHRFEARVSEISISHFLCVFKESDPHLEVATRLSDVQLMVGGPVLNVDAVVMLKRLSAGASPEMVYVCGFVHKGKTALGLEVNETATLMRLIQTYFTQQIEELVQNAYQKKRTSLVKKTPLGVLLEKSR